MKNQKLNPAILTLSLAFILNGVSLPASAGLVRQEIQSDAIATEEAAPAAQSAIAQADTTAASDSNDDVVVERRIIKKVRQVAPKRVIVTEVQEEDAAPAVAQAPQAQSVGSTLDASLDKKMADTRKRMEDSLIKAVENIKISVGDEQAAAAPQAAPVATTVVQDNISNKAAAPEKIYLDPQALGPEQQAQTTEAKKDSDDIKGNIAIFPMGGISSINSNNYRIDAKYSAGLGVEFDVGSNLTAVASYMYSQYDVGLSTGSSMYGYYGAYNNNMNTLGYNQNVFTAGMRYYLMPKSSRYRAFLGLSTGMNRGYLNYKNTSSAANPYYYSQFGNLNPDYEVNSFLGILETGGDVQISKTFSVGAMFRYHLVLSSSENQPLNNYGFYNVPNYSLGTPGTPQMVGGSLRDNSFYSILGTVKVSF